MKRALLLLAVFALSSLVGATVFTDINAGLTGLAIGSSAWCDFDCDEYLDIFLTGNLTRFPNSQKTTKIYHNNGNGTFTDTYANLPGVTNSSVSFADYDLDGDNDILLTGLIGPYQPVSRIYRNDGSFVFTDINAGLTGVEDGASDWGDYDNDGHPDIIITGMVYDEYYVSKIYKNNGNGTFTDIDAGLNGMGSGSVEWGDYDADGDLDILACGWDYFTKMATIYSNDGDDVFTDIQTSFTGVYRGSIAWWDFDGDDDLDVLLSGFTGTSCIMKLYENDNGNYIEANANFHASRGGEISLADYDRDGDKDILHWGFNGTSYVNQVFNNNGGNTFTDANAGFISGIGCSSSWGDFDNDGDPDILVSAVNSSGNSISLVYRNDTAPPDPVPIMPVEVVFDMQPAVTGDALLSWQPVTTDANGNSFTPDYYIILCSSALEDNGFEFLDYTTNLTYVHSGVSLDYNSMFYKVIACMDNDGKFRKHLAAMKASGLKFKYGKR